MAMTAQELADLMPDATQLESNEPEMESSLHYAQLALLVACLEWLWRTNQKTTPEEHRTDFFIGANLTIYFSRGQLKNRDFRGSDFFLVKHTKNHPRKSWVVWEEGGQYPDLIIELLSDSTAKIDKTLKKELYQDRFRTPEYFWFSPETLEFEGYRLVNQCYVAIAPDQAGWLWSQVLGLYLGVQQGVLRYFLESGELVLTPEEAAVQAQTQAQQAEVRAAKLAEQLKALGIKPEA
ncbi:MAG: Uma2 family endonuclease [Cyanothece sp. SIO1E1]|nr:Uma2 family endonuclease [Cyanothece sp. SIO1E1]